MTYIDSATVARPTPSSLAAAEELIAELEDRLVLSSLADIIIKCFSPDPTRSGNQNP